MKAQMNHLDIAVDHVMTVDIKVLHPKDKLRVAKDYFDQYHFHHLPVAVMGKLQGIISMGDLLLLERQSMDSFDNFLMTKKYDMATVDQIMTTDPIAIPTGTTLSQALNTMLEHRINALPVTDNDDLAGIITSHDMLKYLQLIIKD